MPFPADPLGLYGYVDEDEEGNLVGPSEMIDPFAPEQYPEEQFDPYKFQNMGRYKVPMLLPTYPDDDLDRGNTDFDRGIMDIPVETPDMLMQQRRGLAPTPDMRAPDMGVRPGTPQELPEDYDYDDEGDEIAEQEARGPLSTEQELAMVQRGMAPRRSNLPWWLSRTRR